MIKPKDKFILVRDFPLFDTRRAIDRGMVIPRGLMVTVTKVHLNRQRFIVSVLTVRDKRVAKELYAMDNIDPKEFETTGYWGSSARRYDIIGEDALRFLNMEGLIHADAEYLRMTKPPRNK